MIPIEKTKVVNHVYPSSTLLTEPTALTVSNYIDTKGYSHLRVLLTIGDATVALTAAPKLQSADTTAGTFADITGAVLAAAPTATADGFNYAIDVDLTNGTHGRFVQCLATKGTDATTGTGVAVVGILSRNEGSHDGLATDAGLNELISS